MRTVIFQSVVLPAPAESLFAMYTDPAKHAVITGAPVAISVEPGSPFQAFNGALTGATLQIIPQRLVIQSWRSTIPKPLSINLKRGLRMACSRLLGSKDRDQRDANHHQRAPKDPRDARRVFGETEPAEMIEDHRHHRRGGDE
jgi:hypothetical protein